MTNRVFIIGGNHHNTFSVVKCFGQAGLIVEVVLFDCEKSYIASSKYVKQTHYIGSPLNLISFLRSIIDNTPKPVLISCADVVSQQLDENYEELSPLFYFFSCNKQGLLSQYLNKYKQIEIAESVNLYVPKSIIYGDGVSNCNYPCIIKPLNSVNGGKHIEVCLNHEQFLIKIQNFGNTTPVIIQSFIERIEEIVVVGLSSGKDVLIPGYVKKIREQEGGTTYSTVCEICQLDEVLVDHCKQLIKQIGYEGLFGIEFVKGKDGIYYFIEVNLRNDATTYSLAIAGTNLPLLYYNTCAENRSITGSFPVRSIRSIVEINDFNNVLHRKIGLFKWLKQCKTAECHYFYNKEDKKPYRIACRLYVVYLLRRAVRSIMQFITHTK